MQRCVASCACCVDPAATTTSTTTIFLLQPGMYPSSLAKQSTLLDACWEENEVPSPQHKTNGVQCQQSQRSRGAKRLARQLVGSFAHWLVFSSAHRLIGSSAHWLSAKQSTLLNECWEEDEDPSPQHGTNRVRANEADQIRELNNWLVGLLACRLIGSSVHEEISLDYYIFPGTGETLEFFFLTCYYS